MDAKENLRQFHGFTGITFNDTEGDCKVTYDATSEGKIGEFCRDLNNHTYAVYEAGYEDGSIEGYCNGMEQGKKLGASIVLGGISAIGCTVLCLYLLSAAKKKSKIKQPCLKKESE